MESQTTLTPAERMYKNHLKNVSNFQKRNPEKMALKYKKRIEKLKQNPEEYRAFRNKRNECAKIQSMKKKALKAEKAPKKH